MDNSIRVGLQNIFFKNKKIKIKTSLQSDVAQHD
jgi:hypothetical protein